MPRPVSLRRSAVRRSDPARGRRRPKPVDWYFSEFDKADELLEAKEDLIDPIKSFNGQQAKIFDEATKLLNANTGNPRLPPAGSTDAVNALLTDANAFRGNKMNQLKAAADTLQGLIDDVVRAQRSDPTDAIQGRKSEIRERLLHRCHPSSARETWFRASTRFLRTSSQSPRSPLSSR